MFPNVKILGKTGQYFLSPTPIAKSYSRRLNGKQNGNIKMYDCADSRELINLIVLRYIDSSMHMDHTAKSARPGTANLPIGLRRPAPTA
jgi:hypothetical protein